MVRHAQLRTHGVGKVIRAVVLIWELGLLKSISNFRKKQRSVGGACPHYIHSYFNSFKPWSNIGTHSLTITLIP